MKHNGVLRSIFGPKQDEVGSLEHYVTGNFMSCAGQLVLLQYG
jgi:hypothetical protein